LAFDHFEAVNLAFYLASAPGRVDSRGDGGNVFLEAVGKTDNVAKFASLGPFNPLSELKGISGRERSAERQRRATEILDLRALIRDPVQKLSLLLGYLIGGASDQDGGVFRRDPLRSVGLCSLAGLPPIGYKPRHHGTLSLVAFLLNFFVEKGCVMTSLIPALLKIGAELIHLRWRPMGRLAFWKLSTAEPAANGLALKSQCAANCRL